MSKDLKTRTAGTLKWNLVDRVASQVLYGVTGVVLARLLSPADFGLVGAVLVFQAFSTILVDSGFSYALIQRKDPTHLDYSTVLWFNIGTAAVLYIVLYACAPLIADCFQGDKRLVPLSRVLFLSLIVNAASIVQTNRLMKRMEVRMVAVSNALGLALGAVAGVGGALAGWGAWAIVGQTLVNGMVRTAVLWTTSHWRPMWRFSWPVLRGFFGIGGRMMLTSFLNTIFLNVYAFLIGNRVGMTSLGYYTQADKWSKMGIASLSQVVTSSFLPTLSAVQDDDAGFAAACSKMNRFTSYVLFPVMLGLAVMAPTIFHVLFGAKWDPAIILFQILLVRGIFVVFSALWNNFLLARGHAGTILWLEILRDGVALVALVLTFPYITLSTGAAPTEGITLLLAGQLLASFVTWIVTLVVCVRVTRIRIGTYLSDMAPYLLMTLFCGAIVWAETLFVVSDGLRLIIQAATGLGLYLIFNHIAGSGIQRDAFRYLGLK